MGRPKADEEKKRVVQVNIRLTTKENEELNNYAAASGISPAHWIRHKIFVGQNPPIKISPLNAAIYQELRKIGVNMNQIAHKVNQGESNAGFTEVHSSLVALLNKVCKALVS
ncbi:MAG TPA: plasmid mobilization relaxosome protein MobC [Cyclobacteriaceae bacterium]|nr:plasmid mobilization relaxosome protein MobC [Cyclobacteriaceae bacterium]